MPEDRLEPAPPALRPRLWRAILRALPALLVPAMLIAPPAAAGGIRLKDLVEVEGVRGNDLVGYGLVVGLDGTGDSLRNAPFTEEIMSAILERLGVNIAGEQFRPRNVAAVMVTGVLPPFARSGSRIDISVSAIGDARSLLGGTLVMTPLTGADGEVYALAQGPVLAGGVAVEGAAARLAQGVPTAGAIPGGARVEREVAFDFGHQTRLHLALKSPDFTTAARIEAAINGALGSGAARMLDAGTVVLHSGAAGTPSPAHLIARIENITVAPATRARVVVDQRSGTIVLGADVRISRVAVAQGGLTLRVEETPLAVMPNPFSTGETVIVPRTEVAIDERPPLTMTELETGTTLADVVAGLNALGVSPRDMIDILHAIDSAGALHAEFVLR